MAKTVGGLLKVCVSNSSEDTLSNRPTVLPKTLCLQLYISSEDTLSAVLHFFRRHFVCSSAALYDIWSGVLHFFPNTSCLLCFVSTWHFVYRSTFLPTTPCLYFSSFYMTLCLEFYISFEGTYCTHLHFYMAIHLFHM